jgi:hypothetical protein
MTYRTIDIGDREVRPRGIEARPELQWLRIADLVIDEDYQRPLKAASWRQIEKIAAAFTWSHFSPVLVAPVGERFAIIDGQHRTHAAKLVGLSEVPCMVIDLDESAQARAFAAVNGVVTAVNPGHVYKAALQAGEPWALAAKAAVENAGARLVPYTPSGGDKRPGEVYCVAYIRHQVELGRANLLTLSLSAINRCSSRGDLFVWQYPFLRALMTVLQKVPRAQKCDLVGFLDAHPPARLDHGVHLLRLSADADPDLRTKSHAAIFAEALQAQMERWVATGGGR